MMLPENTWRRVRSASDPATGERVVLLSGVFDGVRLWCEKHWSKPDPVTGERNLVHERFTWLNPEDVRHPGRWQSSAAGAMREMEQSKLNEERSAAATEYDPQMAQMNALAATECDPQMNADALATASGEQQNP